MTLGIKILLITQYPEGKPIYGGVEAVSKYLIDELIKINIIEELHIVSWNITQENFLINSITKEKGVHFFINNIGRFQLLTGYSKNTNIVKRFCDSRRIDLIHAQGMDRENVVATNTGYPTITTIHGIVPFERKLQTPHPSIPRKIRMNLAETLDWRALRKSKLIISTSSYDRNVISEKTYTEIVTIPNPISPDFFSINESDLTKEILFVGVIQKRKRIMEIISAFKKIVIKVPDSILKIIGPVGIGEAEYFNSIKELIEQSKLQQKIKLLGHISQEQLLEQYGKCRLLIMLSEEETSPMSIAQALACGKPVISSNVGGITDLVVHMRNGFLVDKDDIDGFTNYITLLLLDDQLCIAMGKESKILANCRRPDVVARQTIEAYSKVLSR